MRRDGLTAGVSAPPGPVVLGNRLQAQAIRRYHARLMRLGRSGTLEESARQWIYRYARLWRLHCALGRVSRASPVNEVGQDRDAPARRDAEPSVLC